jgi:2'-5' RNA ligase
MTRMFVAAVPPEEVVADLDEFWAPRREAGGFRWTPPEHWHVTLAFMGAVPDRALDDLAERLTRAGRKRRPMELQVGGGGAFPHPDRARVLYAGLSGSDDDLVELSRLATGARAAAGKAGAEVDGQRFHPHLTLARLGRPDNVTRWIRLLEAYAGPTWPLDEIALVASYLGEGPRRRPRHEVVETFPLGR